MSGKEQSEYAEILLSCIEEKYFKDEIALEHHSFARIISGEMKVVQADRSYLFGPGDTLLFPSNQLSTLIKNPKDGLPYRAIVIFFRPERLKEFYVDNPSRSTRSKLIEIFKQMLPLSAYRDAHLVIHDQVTTIGFFKRFDVIFVDQPGLMDSDKPI